jgi:hypothetical protein
MELVCIGPVRSERTRSRCCSNCLRDLGRVKRVDSQSRVQQRMRWEWLDRRDLDPCLLGHRDLVSFELARHGICAPMRWCQACKVVTLICAYKDAW